MSLSPGRSEDKKGVKRHGFKTREEQAFKTAPSRKEDPKDGQEFVPIWQSFTKKGQILKEFKRNIFVNHHTEKLPTLTSYKCSHLTIRIWECEVNTDSAQKIGTRDWRSNKLNTQIHKP